MLMNQAERSGQLYLLLKDKAGWVNPGNRGCTNDGKRNTWKRHEY